MNLLVCPACGSPPLPIRGATGSLRCPCGRLAVGVHPDPEEEITAVFVPQLAGGFQISACGTGLVSGYGRNAGYLPEDLRRDETRHVPEDLVDLVVELSVLASLAEIVLES